MYIYTYIYIYIYVYIYIYIYDHVPVQSFPLPLHSPLWGYDARASGSWSSRQAETRIRTWAAGPPSGPDTMVLMKTPPPHTSSRCWRRSPSRRCRWRNVLLSQESPGRGGAAMRPSSACWSPVLRVLVPGPPRPPSGSRGFGCGTRRRFSGSVGA